MRKKNTKLTQYAERRNTKKSGEPAGVVATQSKNIFVVQKHDASHLHYDFRLAIDGVLVSWAVPKGPPLRAGIKRLALRTDDHPLAYASFEGTIPEGNYGAGTVEIWDQGKYRVAVKKDMKKQLKNGKIEFELHGARLRGAYMLVQTGADDPQKWLLMKKKKK